MRRKKYICHLIRYFFKLIFQKRQVEITLHIGLFFSDPTNPPPPPPKKNPIALINLHYKYQHPFHSCSEKCVSYGTAPTLQPWRPSRCVNPAPPPATSSRENGARGPTWPPNAGPKSCHRCRKCSGISSKTTQSCLRVQAQSWRVLAPT